jgi:hypothetical protein
LIQTVNALVENLRQCLQLKEKIVTTTTEELEFEKLLLAAKIGEHKATIDNLPSWDILCNTEKNCSDKEFFMVLTEHISDQVSRIQTKLNNFKNIKKNP